VNNTSNFPWLRMRRMRRDDFSRRLMRDWVFNPLADEYAMSSDFDDRWRTGGRLDEVIEEAHLDTTSLLEGIERFVKGRPDRLQRLRDGLGSVED